MSVRQFAEELTEEGFRVPGPRKALKILDKLRVQGLVTRIHRSEMVRYKLSTRAGVRSVERRAALVDWEITKKGRKRLDWLQTRP